MSKFIWGIKHTIYKINTMTAKQMAQYIYYKYEDKILDYLDDAKSDLVKCIAVNVVEDTYSFFYDYLKDTNELQNADRFFAYLEEVKTEIEKL